MNLISAVLICALVSSTYSVWLKDLVTTKGLDIGSGFKLHLDDSHDKNSSLFEKHALRLDYGGYGVSIGKRKGREAFEVGFYSNENGEGRGKKMGEMLFPAMIGFKLTTLVVLTFASIGALTIKALGVAKLAFIASAILMILKLFHHEEHKPVFEIEHLGSEHHPVFAEYGGEELGYHSSASGNVYAYNNYVPSAVAESAINNYNSLDPAATNATATSTPLQQQQQQASAASRRRDLAKRRPKLPLVTVHRYSIET